jgi:hypothetical protein
MKKKIDIVYPIGVGSAWNDNELRYSLRSLEKHGRNIGDVYIIGVRLPDFVTGVKFIKDNPKIMNYHAKIAHAYYVACNYVSDDYIIMNDDFILTEETDFSEFKNKVRNYDLKHHLHIYGSGYHYGQQIKATVKVLDKWEHFDNHYPMKFNREKLKEIYEAHKDKIESINTVLMRSLYGNLVEEETEVLPDLKLKTRISKERITDLVKDRFCFSFGDNGLTNELKEWLKHNYPNKSKYEV